MSIISAVMVNESDTYSLTTLAPTSTCTSNL